MAQSPMHHKKLLWGVLAFTCSLVAPLTALADSPSPTPEPPVTRTIPPTPTPVATRPVLKYLRTPLSKSASKPASKPATNAASAGKLAAPRPKLKTYAFSEIWTLIENYRRVHRSHFSAELIGCLIWEESGFRLAENPTSGALGFGQILPSTLREVNKRYKKTFTRAQLLTAPEASVEATVLTLELMWAWKKEKTASLLAYAGGMRNYNSVRKWLTAEPLMLQARWAERAPAADTRGAANAQMVNALKICSQPGFDPKVLF